MIKPLILFFTLAAINLSALPSSFSNIQDPSDLEDFLKNTSLEIKIGQLFIGIVNGESLDKDAIAFLDQTCLGNILYFNWANQLKSPQQISKLSAKLKDHIRERTGIPPLIAIDQEGGIVTRLREPFIEFPGNMALAATQDPHLAFLAGLAMGYEMAACGINTNFAPVVDINDNLANPVIGVRSFGDRAAPVTEFARHYIKGLHQQGIFSTLKHFPGHGNASQDTHTSETIIFKSEAQLKQTEFYPFRKLASETDLVMTGHIKIPSLDPSHCATVSKILIQKYLREYCHFNGVVVTDCLTMNGVSPNQSTFEKSVEVIGQSSIKAFLAGCDCLLIAGSPISQKRYYEMMQLIIQKFKEAIQKGTISEKKVDESLKRILSLKLKLKQTQTLRKVDGRAIAKEIAKKSLTLMSPQGFLKTIPNKLASKNVLIILPQELKETLNLNFSDTFPLAVTFPFGKMPLSELQRDELSKALLKADLVLFLSYNAHLMPEQIKLMQTLSQNLPQEKIIFAGLKNPHDLLKLDLHSKHLVYLTYSPASIIIHELLNCIRDKTLPTGKIPVKESGQ